LRESHLWIQGATCPILHPSDFATRIIKWVQDSPYWESASGRPLNIDWHLKNVQPIGLLQTSVEWFAKQ
ncbi:hypothetical protein, partial [Deinococcus arenicola]